MQEKAKELRANPRRLREILDAGAEKCRVIAKQTIEEVKTKMGLV